MKSLYRGILVAVLQCSIVLSVAAKYAWDRERLPRVWVKAVPFDPNLPGRGRYVSLRLEVDARRMATNTSRAAQLSIEGGRLIATADLYDTGVSVWCPAVGTCSLEPIAFFIPEHIPDPSRRQPSEELWVEVSVPPRGVPRPIQLGVKKDGVLRPLDLR